MDRPDPKIKYFCNIKKIKESKPDLDPSTEYISGDQHLTDLAGHPQELGRFSSRPDQIDPF